MTKDLTFTHSNTNFTKIQLNLNIKLNVNNLLLNKKKSIL